jgi:hypothetical protein
LTCEIGKRKTLDASSRQANCDQTSSRLPAGYAANSTLGQVITFKTTSERMRRVLFGYFSCVNRIPMQDFISLS